LDARDGSLYARHAHTDAGPHRNGHHDTGADDSFDTLMPSGQGVEPAAKPLRAVNGDGNAAGDAGHIMSTGLCVDAGDGPLHGDHADAATAVGAPDGVVDPDNIE
jgi:hypothetical protein